MAYKIGIGAGIPDCLAHWSFDNESDLGHDDTGNGNQATIYGATPVAGISGKALEFDGVNDYCTIPNPQSTAYSLCTWYKRAGTGSTQTILYTNRSVVGGKLIIRIGTDNKINALCVDSSLATQTIIGPVTTTDLEFVSLVHTGSAMSLYVNGALISTVPTTMTSEHSAIARIGVSGTVLAQFFSGTIDEPRIYNRALSAEEVLYLYENPGQPEYLPNSMPYTDISSLVDIASVTRETRLFSELRPNLNTLRFRMLLTAPILAALVTNDNIECAVTKDASAYFTGVLSPNYATKIKQGQRYIDIIVEDYSLSRLGKTINTTLVYSGYSVCNPASPSTSLVHVLTTLAGVTLAAGAPTIAATVPFLLVMPDDKSTYQTILSDLLYEYSYVHGFNASGEMTITVAVNSGTVTTTSTLNAVIATGGNIRGEMEIKKAREKYDDIRVNFKSLEYKSSLVLFNDTTGATGALESNIELAPGAYYPKGASATTEIFSEWKNPDGYTIHIATSAAMDATIPSGVTMPRALSNYYRRASFAYLNGNGAPAYITRLKITGSAWVVSAENVARSNPSSGIALMEYSAKYIFDTSAAQALAKALNQYYAHSDFSYSIRSKANIAIGTYVLVEDTAFSGVSQKCRVIGRVDSATSEIIEYSLDAVADFADITLVLEGTAAQVFTNATDQIIAMADDGMITPQEKNNIALRWQDINGDGYSSGSYWPTRSTAINLGIATGALDSARSMLVDQLFTSPGVLVPATWESNTTISVSAFQSAWSLYYKSESQMLTTISRWAKFAYESIIDCGEYFSIADTDTGEYDCGEYPDPYAPGNLIDCGEPAASTDPANSIIDMGEVSATPPVGNYDLGEFIEALPTFIKPRRVIDCGVYGIYE